MTPPKGWEAVIGLEVHAQLATRSKLFCACPTRFGDPPNSNTCPVCFGYPGVLPVLNEQALELGLRAALALDCEIPPMSRFARKNYFYPDLPKGYQISQYELPLAVHGRLEVPSAGGGSHLVAITRAHMEEDAGKLVHATGAAGSLVDLNRAGTPLLEIVSEPDLRAPSEAADYMRAMRSILRYVGVCDGNMAEGSLRCDGNISVRPMGETELGTKVEIKNLNSFRYLERALDHEIERQIELIEDGGEVVQETRLFDPAKGVTRAMRSKESAHDYRYFPDPDLPPLRIDAAHVERVRASLPELPAARRRRFQDVLALGDNDATLLTSSKRVADFFEEVIAADAPRQLTANWIVNVVLPELEGEDPDPGTLTMSPADLAKVIRQVAADEVPHGTAKRAVLAAMKDNSVPILEVHRVDEGALTTQINAVLEENPDEVDKYRAGKTKLLGFFVGQVMKRTGGKANPKRVGELVRERLKG